MQVPNKKNILNQTLLLLLCIATIGCNTKSVQTDSENLSQKTHFEKAALELTERVLQKNASHLFEFNEITTKENGKDVFKISSTSEGKILIEGNNGISMVSGFNWYLENYCNTQISLSFEKIQLPEKMPLLEQPIRKETPFEYRYFFNFCTFGYTMPWWDWDQWEQMIDYLSMKGVNMPLATIGQEAVWKEVYQDMGFTAKEMQDYFVGPAHLPWGRMGNIDGMAGPLPDNWIEKRKFLQQKILQRMRKLGMKPVLSAFTGHVPSSLKRLYPKANIYQINDWAGVEGSYFLDPNDPLFIEIGTAFINKQKEIFGTDHLYDADCFIEVDPPSGDKEFLDQLGQKVYKSMATADPQAKWVLQGWFFFFRKDFWNKERGQAFLGGIPKDKVLILDLYGEKNPTWDKTDAFYGQPWIWNVICNEDQKVNMSGDLSAMQKEFQRAHAAEIQHNLKGIGVIPEGLGYNDVVQDFVLEKTWEQSPVNLNDWINNYARKRYQTDNKSAEAAWTLFMNSVYGRTRTMWSPLLLTPKLKTYEFTKEDPFAWDFEIKQLALGLEKLHDAEQALATNKTYQFDVTNVSRELLASLTHRRINALTIAFQNKNITQFEAAAAALLQLLDDLNNITGTNKEFLLGRWIQDARSWGETDAEKDYYESNARTIVTIWQPYPEGALRDYAAKQWNGLFIGYYKPRWELFIHHLRNDLKNGQQFSQAEFDLQVRQLDFKWTQGKERYPVKPIGNSLEWSKKLYQTYRQEFLNPKF